MNTFDIHDEPTYVPTGDEHVHYRGPCCAGCRDATLPHDGGGPVLTPPGAPPAVFASGTDAEVSPVHTQARDFAQGHEAGLVGFEPQAPIRHLFSTAWHSGHAIALTSRARSHYRSQRRNADPAQIRHHMRRADSAVRFRDHGAVELP